MIIKRDPVFCIAVRSAVISVLELRDLCSWYIFCGLCFVLGKKKC